jgi:hypothetical protein
MGAQTMPKKAASSTQFAVKLLIGLTEEQAMELDAWRRDEDDLPSRTEAVRRMIAEALANRARKRGRK